MTLRLRPPAVPLVTHDPYFSAWSLTDNLTDSEVSHWTGTDLGTCGLIRIDGVAYRLMGKFPQDAPALPQTALAVWPLRTIYEFEGAGVGVTLTFLSPLLPDDLDVLARPVSYLTWDVRSTDGASHDVSLYLHCQGQWAVNTIDQPVVSARYNLPGLDVLRLGTVSQAVLGRSGDNLRIDWGHMHLVVPRDAPAQTALAGAAAARASFVATGGLPAADEMADPAPVQTHWPVLACAFPLGRVEAGQTRTRHVLLAYDDQFSLELFHRKLRPYWRRGGIEFADLLQMAAAEYDGLSDRCRAFDEELSGDLQRAGGADYAALCALSCRQCIAAHKLAADFDGTPVFFSKENFSNGCINTVDVTYPSAPFFLLFNPELLKAQLTAILDYGQSPRWKFPFAPHDLGTYPLANGQVYGGGERTEDDQMPVEECGNMLILVAALVKTTGDTDYARRYWPLLTRWAAYLYDKGLNPANQLCTDDFAGHMAHNVNLSVKAIVALGAYAHLAAALDEPDRAATYRNTAREMAAEWQTMADDGDHFRLAFDQPGSWSQKYNLVWDRLLGLDLFPPSVAAKEIAFYKTRQGKYGLPLDSRGPQTKLDWIVWTATLAESSDEFAAFIAPVLRFIAETPSRVPLTDWYDTETAKKRGFQARSVVGGVFIKLLTDAALWDKWRGRGSEPASRH